MMKALLAGRWCSFSHVRPWILAPLENRLQIWSSVCAVHKVKVAATRREREQARGRNYLSTTCPYFGARGKNRGKKQVAFSPVSSYALFSPLKVKWERESEYLTGSKNRDRDLPFARFGGHYARHVRGVKNIITKLLLFALQVSLRHSR